MAQVKCFGSINKNIPLMRGGIFYCFAMSFLSSLFASSLSSLNGRLSPYSSMRTLIQPAIGMATIAPMRPNM